MPRSRSIYHRAIRRHGRILGPTVGALEAMRALDNPWTPPTKAPDVCDHSLTYCPNLAQKDSTRFCELCGVEMADYHETIKGAGYATLPMLTVARLQELHDLRRLVANIHREFDTGQEWCAADICDVVADYLRRAGYTVRTPEEGE